MIPSSSMGNYLCLQLNFSARFLIVESGCPGVSFHFKLSLSLLVQPCSTFTDKTLLTFFWVFYESYWDLTHVTKTSSIIVFDTELSGCVVKLLWDKTFKNLRSPFCISERIFKALTFRALTNIPLIWSLCRGYFLSENRCLAKDTRDEKHFN